jgi:hypothetical protein
MDESADVIFTEIVRKMGPTHSTINDESWLVRDEKT